METGEDCSLEVGQIEQVRFLRRNGASFEKIKFHKKSMFPFGVWLGSPYRRETSDTILVPARFRLVMPRPG
jgi:hypothetical protein